MVDFSEIRTRIVRVEGEHTDALITSREHFWSTLNMKEMKCPRMKPIIVHFQKPFTNNRGKDQFLLTLHLCGLSNWVPFVYLAK